MNNKLFTCTRNRVAGFARFVLVLVVSLFAVDAARAEIVELNITGHWSEGNFKVIGGRDAFYNVADPKFDGKVFGVNPSEGSVTVQLLVSTDGGIFFAKGSRFTAEGVGEYELAHDFYGYRDVRLVGDTFSFGTALWRSDGILSGLEGPDRVKAALWTDVDITKDDPARVSFRMFGKADGLSADLFVGSRSHKGIGGQFLLWEYYKGEEIRSMKYTIKSRPLRF